MISFTIFLLRLSVQNDDMFVFFFFFFHLLRTQSLSPSFPTSSLGLSVSLR